MDRLRVLQSFAESEDARTLRSTCSSGLRESSRRCGSGHVPIIEAVIAVLLMHRRVTLPRVGMYACESTSTQSAGIDKSTEQVTLMYRDR